MPTDQASISAFELARWVRDARAGSQRAFAALYGRFLPLVHGILLGRFRPAVADELTQECFATAFTRLAQLQEPHKFGAWVAVMARRITPHEPRHRAADSALTEHASATTSPEDQAEAERLLRAIAALPEAYRETLILRLVEQLSGPEIAELTGLAPDSVRVNLHRGMEKLRETLGIDRATASAGART